MQDNNTDDGGLKKLEPIDSGEGLCAGRESAYSLALEEENDGQSGFDGVVESDCEQITQAGSKE